MYRHRNRPKYSAEELAELYKTPYDHTRWPDHIQRVEKTIEVGRALVGDSEDFKIADLSCGDAAIGETLQAFYEDCPDGCCEQLAYRELILGDFGPGYEYQGPIEENIDKIPPADLFICSETLEHLDNPEDVLSGIRSASRRLLLSTPNCSWPDPNPEHYWSWDAEAVQDMLVKTGWQIDIAEESYYIQENGQPLGYRYQIYGCS